MDDELQEDMAYGCGSCISGFPKVAKKSCCYGARRKHTTQKTKLIGGKRLVPRAIPPSKKSGKAVPLSAPIAEPVKKKTSSKKGGSKKTTTGDTKKKGSKRKKGGTSRSILKQIRQYQQSTDLLLQKRPFSRLVRDIMDDYIEKEQVRFNASAMMALQEVIETQMVMVCTRANMITMHAKRVTVAARDLSLAEDIMDTDSIVDVGFKYRRGYIEGRKEGMD